ncbi:RidA family protein [Herbaspirillum autotrophicum]|uniref:RidA family protein n=1 Tax=Herbaspirillum autotrophicum TaxID=180195 RepID=UPI00067E4658|nr:RidA family protein [Herbaspirillum autotrophicum]
MSEIKRSHIGPRLSQVAEYQGVLYLAGQVARNVDVGIKGQTEEVLATIDRLLAEQGSDKSRILQCTIYLDDMALAADMNAVWDAWVTPGHAPARATVQAKLATPQKLIEITIIAAAGK